MSAEAFSEKIRRSVFAVEVLAGEVLAGEASAGRKLSGESCRANGT